MAAERPRELLAEVIVDLASATDVIIELREREDQETGPSLDWVERTLGLIADDLDATWDEARPRARDEVVQQLDRAGAIAAAAGLPEMADALSRLAASLRRLASADPRSGGYGASPWGGTGGAKAAGGIFAR